MSSQQNNKGKGDGQGPRKKGLIIGAVLWALVLVVFFNFIAKEISNAGTKEVPYSDFTEMVEEDKVAVVEMTANKYTFYLKEDLPDEGKAGEEGSEEDLAKVLAQQMEKGGATRYVTAPLPEPDTELLPLLRDHEVKHFSPIQEESSYLVRLLASYVIPMVIMVGLLVFLMRRVGGGMGGLGGVGKANAKVYMEKSTGITFADVAGQDEAKESLVEIIDFLHNPGKYTEIGAKLPKGALLVGPPGTGKTLLAKAVAGEAGVHFLSISGSDFVELYVGVGASRVRDLFDQAKKNAPAIVFIDEIDAVGRQRGAGLGGGHDEREQTLNQLLVEMDGFGNNEGVVVMAATNRQDILDPALLRPGRFDRQVYVGHPDIKGREAILKVHARNKPLGDDVSLAELAKGTGGFTGADLENLMNEAALLAARRHHRFISMAELNEAVIKVIAGPEKKSRVVIERERKLTAYHEAGHAIVIHDLPTQDPVHEITIIPRGMAGGMTISLPQEDVTFQTRQQLTERIAVCLGGRAAEQLALGDISTGAGNDLQKASAIARNMVTRYGMSEKVGNVVFDSGHDEVFIGRSMAQTKNYSEEVAALIDEEVKALVDGAYARCGEILTHRRRELDIVAEYLLQYENMDAKTFEQVFTDPAALQPPAAYQAVEAEAEQDAREEEEHGVD